MSLLGFVDHLNGILRVGEDCDMYEVNGLATVGGDS
jgi:hypothetical protein